jgi:hypothetical protein
LHSFDFRADLVFVRRSKPGVRWHEGGRDHGNVVMIGKDDDFRANLDAAVQIDNVFIQHADAAARNLVADCFRAVGAVNSVNSVAEIDGSGPEWVAILNLGGPVAKATASEIMEPKAAPAPPAETPEQLRASLLRRSA